MRNSPLLPLVALVLAVVLAGIAAAAVASAGERGGALNELELGAVAGALAFGVFGVQGLLSVGLEGVELRPGRTPAHLTRSLTAVSVIAAVALFAVSLLLGYGIVTGWDTARIGVAAGIGCALLALLLIFYKEAFLGDETVLETRDDGIPW
ncbi:MAG: hypothetical protein IT337_09020 [Thermomicrobiales bacterium]|nr:hypothetical protein [Thermomicrobiales bacterium]